MTKPPTHDHRDCRRCPRDGCSLLCLSGCHVPGTMGMSKPKNDQPPQTEGDDYRQPCPNGCYGRLGDGCHGEPVPRYCGQNGCDAESPGMSYKPDEEWGPDSAAQELERGPR